MPEPTFIPKPGQIDFTHARYCPVINCVLKYENKFLVVQRSSTMRIYPNHWNGISVFLDDNKNLADKVKEELSEELGLREENIISITQKGLLEQEDESIQKVWIVHPVLVEVNTDGVKTDWEAQNYAWLTLDEIRKLDLLPGFDKVLGCIE